MASTVENQVQERFPDVLQTAPFAIYDIDYNGPRFKHVNQAMCKLTGFSEQELLSINPLDLLDPQSAKHLKERINQGLTGQVIDSSFEFKLKTKGGREVWAIFQVKPTYKDGKLDNAIVFGFDITERKIVEEALKESEEKYRSIVETAQEGILTADLEGKVTYANNKIAKMLGYEVEELVGKQGLELIVDKEKAHIQKRIEDRKQGINEPQYEIWMKTKQGNAICLLASGSPIINSQGLYVGNLGLYTDITERKKTEETIKENEKTFLELIERAPFGIYVVNSQFRISQMNKGSQNGAFRNVRPLIGRPFNEAMHILWPDQVAEEIISHFRHTLETGEPYYSPKFINPRHDAEIVEAYEWEIQRIRLPDGQYGVICYYFDSTLLRETERVLSEAQAKLKEYATNLENLVEERTKQLKDSERLAAIGATAGMVGHDIRNPLQAIIGDLFFAKQEIANMPDTGPKKSVVETLDEIEANIFYINKIVSDLQDYARPLNPHTQESNIETIIEYTIANSHIPKNIKTDVKIDNDANRVLADPDYLKRIIGNLTMNAVQAMPNGGKLTITVCKDRTTGNIIIIVKDTGVGIPDNVKEKLFTPMFTTKSKGQGLGLAVVKRLVEILGGAVTFESEVGKGTKFIIELPVAKS